MGPEALLRGHISKAADVYSFGVTLWELLTGCHAYHGKRKTVSWACISLCGLPPSAGRHMPPETAVTMRTCLCHGLLCSVLSWFCTVLCCEGIPRALLGHQVAVVGLRPAFPEFTPYEYRNLAERCWLPDPDKRWAVPGSAPASLLHLVGCVGICT